MANDYFNHTQYRIGSLTRALDTQINNIGDAIALGFDKIPDEQDVRSGTVTLATNSGTANALVASLAFTPSLSDGYLIRIRCADTNIAGATTLNLNSLGVKNVLNSNKTELTAGAIAEDSINDFYWDAAGDQWIMTSNNSAWGVPSGFDASSYTELCPGYTYVFSTTSIWQVAGLDVTQLFRQGRRCKFVDGASTYYGTVASSAFSTDSSMTMTMEGTDVLTSTITEVCLTSSSAGWSQISTDPFIGSSINAIATGVIASTQWWVAVGDGGKLATSTDKGVSWTIRSSGVTENFTDVAYNSDAETFIAVANDGRLTRTADGSTWASPGDLNSVVTTGTGKQLICYDVVQDLWLSLIYHASGTESTYSAPDSGSMTWTVRETSIGGTTTCIVYASHQATSQEQIFMGSNDDIRYLDNALDTSTAAVTALTNVGATVTAINFNYDGSEDRTTFGMSNGTVKSYKQTSQTSASERYIDDATFSDAIRGIAYSALYNITVIVGDVSTVGYIDDTTDTTDDAITSAATAFNPTANVLDVAFNETDGVFIAVADNGQICRSSNGIN